MFIRIFNRSNFWALVRGLAVCLVIYMGFCFIWPLVSRAANTTHYAVFQMPADAGNWIGNKLGLKPGVEVKTTELVATPDTSTPTFGALQGGQLPASVAFANQERDLGLKAEELRFQAQKAGVWKQAVAQGEALERALCSGTPNPARTVSVTVYDQNNQPILVGHELIVERAGETEVIPCSPNSTKHLQVGYGPLRVRIGAQVPGTGFSDFQVAEFAADEVGKKRLQLHVTMSPVAITPPSP